MHQIIEAASIARQQSNAERQIEIIVCEFGFIVRGAGRANGLIPISAVNHLSWAEYEHAPYLLANTVRLVAAEMDRQE